FYLADDAASPKMEQVNTIEALDTLDLHLNSVPTSGTVYRFTATATTGIFQPSLPLASFDVFPNPTTDRFVVRLPEGTTDRDSRLGIFDTSGRQVKDLPFQDGNFDLNGLPGGVYQLRVLIPTGQAFTGRIVKQ
ncbi:MAG: T9SS type A sorting domain-containing protein, partial [Lewinella sp.]